MAATQLLIDKVTAFLAEQLGRAPTSEEVLSGLVSPWTLSNIHNDTDIVSGAVSVAPGDSIQDAIDTLSTVGYGIVNLQPGTYAMTDNLNVSSNITINGNGAILDFDSSILHVQVYGSNSYTTGTVAVSNFDGTVVGTGTAFDQSMIGQSILLEDFWYTIGSVIDASTLELNSAYLGTTLTAANTIIATTVDNVVIHDLVIKNSHSNGIDATYVNNLTLANITTDTVSNGVNVAGIAIFNGSRVLVTNVNGTISDFGIYFKNVHYGEMSNVSASLNVVTGVRFDSCTNWKVDTLTVSTTVGSRGMYFDSCSNFTVDSFSVAQSAFTAVYLDTNNSDIIFTSGNINTTTTATQSGFNLNTGNANIQIEGCNITNCTNFGINNSSPTNTDLIVVGNYFANNTNGSISDNGLRTIIRGNSGLLDNNPQTYRVTTQFDSTSTTFAQLAALTAPSKSLVAGNKYQFEAVLYIAADATGGYKVATGMGSAPTSFTSLYERMVSGGGTSIYNINTTYNTGVDYSVGATSLVVRVTGTFVMNASASFALYFAQHAAGGTSSVLVNSTLDVWDSN